MKALLFFSFSLQTVLNIIVFEYLKDTLNCAIHIIFIEIIYIYVFVS